MYSMWPWVELSFLEQIQLLIRLNIRFEGSCVHVSRAQVIH